MFADKLSGKNADRPELAACLDYLRPGDTLVVPSLDRLSRSLADLIQIVGTRSPPGGLPPPCLPDESKSRATPAPQLPTKGGRRSLRVPAAGAR